MDEGHRVMIALAKSSAQVVAEDWEKKAVTAKHAKTNVLFIDTVGSPSTEHPHSGRNDRNAPFLYGHALLERILNPQFIMPVIGAVQPLDRVIISAGSYVTEVIPCEKAF